ncbi:hypothetical protein J6A32_07280 [Methanocorpusculum sp.]|nr:hypothetical protein [Methanocorpusculum sp.]
MAEWNYEKNGDLNPYELTAFSNRKVWWKCEMGHEWEANIGDRSRGDSCPFCSRKRVLKGFNDLATTHPHLAKEWHPTKNGDLTPFDVTSGSSQYVWWQCEKGHEWRAVIYSRSGKNENGCPYCGGRKAWKGFNDLATLYPNLAKEWHPTKNGDLTPSDITIGSNRRVWWQCEKGHEWKAVVYSRIEGNGCPYCSGNKVWRGFNDLATTHPNLAKEWHPTKNGDLTPFDVTKGSNKRVWWICKNGHEWDSTVSNRVRGHNCPVCIGQRVLAGFNDLTTTHPDLAKEWHPTKNGTLKPTEVNAGSNKKVWWKCNMGHEWSAVISSRTSKNAVGCPKCADQLHTSFPEQAIYYYLKQIDVSVKNRELIHGMEIDIYLPSLNTAVEYDGIYYHNSPKAQTRDELKAQKLKDLGIRLIRVRESKSLKDEIQISKDVLTLPHRNYVDYLNDIIKHLIEQLFGDSTCHIDVIHDRQKILESYKQGFLANSLGVKYPELARQWHPTKNGELSPESFTPGSHEKVWWICNKGHEWKAQIKSRVTGIGCPVCAGKSIKIGYNDLATTNPELIREWHPIKNGTVTPYDVTKGSDKKIWWMCDKGHEWEASVSSRIRGRGCPYCANKRILKGSNDLATVNPTLAEEWHPTRNELAPNEVLPGSQKKVWWKCKVCGNEWDAVISSRNSGVGCPECAKKKRVESFARRMAEKAKHE